MNGSTSATAVKISLICALTGRTRYIVRPVSATTVKITLICALTGRTTHIVRPVVRNYRQDYSDLCADGANDMHRSPRCPQLPSGLPEFVHSRGERHTSFAPCPQLSSRHPGFVHSRGDRPPSFAPHPQLPPALARITCTRKFFTRKNCNNS